MAVLAVHKFLIQPSLCIVLLLRDLSGLDGWMEEGVRRRKKEVYCAIINKIKTCAFCSASDCTQMERVLKK